MTETSTLLPTVRAAEPRGGVPLYELGSTGVRVSGGRVIQSRLKNFKGNERAVVIREMSETDGTVKGLLANFTMLGRAVERKVDTKGEGPEDERAREFVEQCLDDMEVSWQDTMGGIFSSLAFGYSYHELNYKRRLGEEEQEEKIEGPDGKEELRTLPPSQYNDGLIGWWGWPIRLQDTISRWDLDKSSRVRGAYQRLPTGSFKETLIPIEKALHFRPTAKDGNPEGESLLEAAYRPWFMKRNFEDLVGIGVKRDLVGYPMMSMPKEAGIWLEQNADKLARAEALIANIARDEIEGLVKPEDVKVELLASAGSRQFDILKVLSYFRLEIAIATLTEFAMVGHEGTGSLALKREATRVFMLALDSVLRSIAGEINKRAIPRLIRLNGMKVSTYPYVEFGTANVPEVEKILEGLAKMAAAGAEIFPNPTLESSLYTALGLPVPTDEDQVGVDSDDDSDDADELDDDDLEDGDGEAAADGKTIGARVVKLLKQKGQKRLPTPDDDEGVTRTPPPPPTQPKPKGENVDREAAADPKVSLNGAQVTAMVDIVVRVAKGELPRETGIEIILAAFNIDRAQAEKIMGAAGKGFKPAAVPTE